MTNVSNESLVDSWLDRECPVPIRYETYRNYLSRRIIAILDDRDNWKEKYQKVREELDQLKEKNDAE